ncbi:putative RNA methyltransferase [Microterricola viridarii]|uniref:23S rRNA m(1)G-748 methyltransferase n=1 Tax=Microterricola viridarii TaxID=412690 RepID=A0A1H1UV71_9MICO|nr:methyltransferase domain-containing protein [Microterricola viridarii]SDS76397.1 23S rRNA m(1)G-748 methyltransferase [Microterricola viridarii]
MTLHTLAEWLRCPQCAEPLQAREPLALACPAGHSFDVNKRGFVNLVPGGSRMIGDSPAMLDARASFLGAGHFGPVRAALVAAAGAGAAPRRIVDAGCGTGYYLDGLLTPGTTSSALAMDISPHAVARAVRGGRALLEGSDGAVDGLVADIWRPLPLRDASADLLFTVFAPRNLPEFHRALAPSGRLVVVVPTARHIRQLREAGQALDIPAEKAERLQAEAAPLFTAVGRAAVEYDIVVSPADAARLVGMGPSAHHSGAEADAGADAADMTVTVSVDVLSFVPR